MTSIYAYQKVFNAYTTIQMALPDNQGVDDSLRCTELCTLDDITYVAVPDGLALPIQPPEITVTTPTLTAELAARIKAASPHVALTYARTQELIRSKYSVDDEAYFARIGVGVALGAYAFESGEQDELLAFGVFVESARQWGRAERARLGL